LGDATTGLVVSYSPEYGDRRDDPQLLRDLSDLTGGREGPIAAAAFEPTGQAVGQVSEIGLPLLWLALLLWPLDIGLRRLHVRWADVAPALFRRRRQAPDPAVQAATMARLGMAKRRAAIRTEKPDTLPAQPAAPVARGSQPPTANEVPAAQASQAIAPAAVVDTAPRPADSGGQTDGDDQFARLMAAKKRARKQRS
jgi:hypothetical protein